MTKPRYPALVVPAGSFRSGQLEVVQALLAGLAGVELTVDIGGKSASQSTFGFSYFLRCTLESGRRRRSLRLSHWCREIFMLSTTSTTFKGKVSWLRQFGHKFGYCAGFCEAMPLSEFWKLPVMFSQWLSNATRLNRWCPEYRTFYGGKISFYVSQSATCQSLKSVPVMWSDLSLIHQTS